ncbi:hypothetical protein K8353_41110 [Burkholderia contaminans]|nr:hypothetical protein [Burkholderia contaminans]
MGIFFRFFSWSISLVFDTFEVFFWAFPEERRVGRDFRERHRSSRTRVSLGELFGTHRSDFDFSTVSTKGYPFIEKFVVESILFSPERRRKIHRDQLGGAGCEFGIDF